jgi:hypothetical protein
MPHTCKPLLGQENGLVMTKNDIVRISIATTEIERNEAIMFIEKNMRQAFGCNPPPTTGIIIVAHIEDLVVGSIALSGTSGKRLFPIENQYRFSVKDTPVPFTRSHIIQGSRWISSRKDVQEIASGLLWFSFNLACGFDKHYMLIEAKPYSVIHLAKLGVLCHPIERTILLEEKVRETLGSAGMKYFTEVPLPTLYMIDLQSALVELSKAGRSL